MAIRTEKNAPCTVTVRGHVLKIHAVLPDVLLAENLYVVWQALFFEQRMNIYVLVGLLHAGGLFEHKHLVLAENLNRGFETLAQHISCKGELEVVIIAKPHGDFVAALYGV